MASTKADLALWARGQRRAALRSAREARLDSPNLREALNRVDELRRFADTRGARVDPRRAERDNLAFHLTWRRVRRAFEGGER